MILINLFFQPVYRVYLKAKLHYITLSAYTLGHGTFITKVERYIKKEVMLLILFVLLESQTTNHTKQCKV